MTTNHPLPICHLTPTRFYRSQPENEPYRTEFLAQEGFIHCTAGADTLIKVANAYFANLQDGLLVLEIDPARLTAPLIFEPPISPTHTASPTGESFAHPSDLLFPHIYGPLNREAIVNRFELQRDGAGKWEFPVK